MLLYKLGDRYGQEKTKHIRNDWRGTPDLRPILLLSLVLPLDANAEVVGSEMAG